MKKIAKILKNLSGRIVGNKSTLFFPMTTLETEDTSGTSLLLEVSTPSYGFESLSLQIKHLAFR